MSSIAQEQFEICDELQHNFKLSKRKLIYTWSRINFINYIIVVS